ncbi:MAG: hypothetical protein ACR2FZ_06950, partial [Thermoleophilaceae bacterium]
QPTPFGCNYDTGRVYLDGSQPPGCARSDVAEILSASIPLQERVNIACSGAAAPDIFRASNGGQTSKGQPPQADRLARIARERRVKLIVLAIGGNDIGFADVATACALAYVTRAGPCAKRERPGIDAKLPAAMRGVAKAISEIRAVMRSAGYRPWHYRLVLQSYPAPFPRAAENRYPEAGLQRSTVGGCPFYDSDSNFARDVLPLALDENLKSVAFAAGAQFLSLRDAFQGREVCSRSSRLVSNASPPSPVTSEWARAIGTGPILQGRTIEEEAHPNAYGQRALGRCLTLLFSRATGSWSCKNTPASGTNGMLLTRVSSHPRAFRMTLKVSPRRVVAGRRTCFRFRVLSAGQPVEGVTVALAGKRARTGTPGRARACVRLRARRYRARARRPGFSSVSVIVTARR